jgi:hypothetical protein
MPEAAMKDEIKAALERSAAGFEARRNQEHKERERKQHEREKFVEEWGLIARTVVVPALEEVAELVRNKQWQARVATSAEAPLSVLLEVFRGNMSAIGGARERPRLTFEIDARSREIRAHAVLQQKGGLQKAFQLQQVTIESVQEEAAKFFGDLADEHYQP